MEKNDNKLLIYLINILLKFIVSNKHLTATEQKILVPNNGTFLLDRHHSEMVFTLLALFFGNISFYLGK